MSNPLSIPALLQEAIALHQSNHLPQAEKLYRQILALAPHNVDALNLLGVLATQVSKFPDALKLFHAALELAPNAPEIHLNLGNALAQSHQHAQAADAFRQALALRPNYTHAQINLGISLSQLGQLEPAAAALEAALAGIQNSEFRIQNLHLSAHQTLAVTYDRLGRYDDSIASAQRALELPGSESFPGRGFILCNLAHAFWRSARADQAVRAAQESLAILPDLPETHQNLALALADLGRLDEALAASDRAAALAPNRPDILNERGNFYKTAGRLDESIAAYRQALALDPGYIVAHSNLIYTLYFHPDYDAAAIAIEHDQYNARFAVPLGPKGAGPQITQIRTDSVGGGESVVSVKSVDRPSRPLRIGYVSPDFFAQAESYFIVPLLESHDHAQFEIHCYASVRNPDATTARLRRAADVWHNVIALSDADLAAQIAKDQIDILVDLTMHMADNRLLAFARKPAPTQVTYLAYPGSTGLTAIDYRLTDPLLDPPGVDDRFYSEKPLYLPTWCVYHPLTDLPPSPPERAHPTPSSPPTLSARANGLSPTGFTFGSLNNPSKLNDPLLKLWARVLAAVPDSRLLLLTASDSQRTHIRNLFSTQAISPARLDFVTRCPRPEYLRLFDRIDIGLDPLPYNGITTTCDSLWMGVPVLSLVGNTAAGRAGLSLLTAAGHPELACHSPEDFLTLATHLAQNPARLLALRTNLRAQMQCSPLMDAPTFTRHLESAYRQIWNEMEPQIHTDEHR